MNINIINLLSTSLYVIKHISNYNINRKKKHIYLLSEYSKQRSFLKSFFKELSSSPYIKPPSDVTTREFCNL